MKFSGFKYLLLCLVPFLAGCKTFHAEITIPAKPDEVWFVMTDEKKFKEWHTVLDPIEGEFQEGGKINYRITEKSGKQYEIKARVIEVVKNKKLNQRGGYPGFLSFNHTFKLKPVKGGTRLIQHEKYSGIMLLFWDTDWIEPAYKKSNENLKELISNQKKK